MKAAKGDFIHIQRELQNSDLGPNRPFLRRILIPLWALFFFCGCSPNSSEDFQREGEARCRLLVADLQKIENREQLLLAVPSLKKHFEGLTDLMIEAKEFQQKRLDDISHTIFFEENAAEVSLENALRRIYAIEGGREIIERAQQEALVRLDAYERSLAKKRERKNF